MKTLVLLAALALPLAAETPVTPPSYVPAAGPQSQPSIASNGDTFFITWDDRRGSDGAWGTRLDADGHALDIPNIDVDEGFVPSVAWNGRNWIAASPGTGGVHTALIATDGTVVARQRAGFGTPAGPNAIASNGTVSVIADVDSFGPFTGPSITIVDNAGAFIARERLPFNPGLFNGRVVIASNGDGFLVAWKSADLSGNTNIEGVFLGRDGHPLSDVTTILLTGTRDNAPMLASDGRDYLVGATSAITGNVELRRVGADGTFHTITSQVHALAAFTWTGSRYVIVAQDLGQWALRPLDANGDTAGLDVPFAAMADQREFALASNGRNVVVAWTAGASLSSDIVALTADAQTLAVRTPAAIVSYSQPPQLATGIATSGRDFAVAWLERQTADAWDAFAEIVSLDGRTTTPQRMNAQGSSVRDARVAWDGHAYDGAWNDTRVVVNALGAQQPPAVIAPCARESGIDITGNGNLALVVWTDCTSADIVAARVRDGRPLDATPLTLAPAATNVYQSQPRAAWNGTDFVVVWREATSLPSPDPMPYVTYRLRAAFVAPDLTVVRVITIDDDNPTPAEIASSGSDSLIVYFNLDALLGRIVTNDGVVHSPFVITPNTGAQSFSVTWDGTSYLVAVDGSVMRVTRDGRVSAAASANGVNVFLAAANGYVMALYDKFDDVTRVYVSPLASPPRARPMRR